MLLGYTNVQFCYKHVLLHPYSSHILQQPKINNEKVSVFFSITLKGIPTVLGRVPLWRMSLLNSGWCNIPYVFSLDTTMKSIKRTAIIFWPVCMLILNYWQHACRKRRILVYKRMYKQWRFLVTFEQTFYWLLARLTWVVIGTAGK